MPNKVSLTILLTALVVAAIFAAQPQPPVPQEEFFLPVQALCVTQTGHIQEMRFCKGWANTFEETPGIRPAQDGDPYLWVIATVHFDEDAGKFFVAYEASYLVPVFQGVAMGVCSSLETFTPTEMKAEQRRRVDRILEVFPNWAKLVEPIFRGLRYGPCEHGTRPMEA